MPTNEERSYVAARLREINTNEWICYGHEFDERITAELMTACGCNFGQDWQDIELCDRLAELIEPETERTCHKELMTEEHDVEYFGCSWCGEYLSGTDCYGLDDGPNYCSNCGHKVDKSIVTDESTGEVIYRDGAKVVE